MCHWTRITLPKSDKRYTSTPTPSRDQSDSRGLTEFPLSLLGPGTSTQIQGVLNVSSLWSKRGTFHFLWSPCDIPNSLWIVVCYLHWFFSSLLTFSTCLDLPDLLWSSVSQGRCPFRYWDRGVVGVWRGNGWPWKRFIFWRNQPPKRTYGSKATESLYCK